MGEIYKILISIFFLLFIINSGLAQHTEETYEDVLLVTPEIQFGLTLPSNMDFPDRKIQKTAQISFSKKNYSTSKKWSSLLNYPTTGLTFSYTNFGNKDKLGTAVSLTPFFEYNFKKTKLKNFGLRAGFGVSYLNKLYDPETNPFNRAASTHFNVNFYLLMNYQFELSKKFPLRIGGGYVHHSNGHSKLPNQGFNSALITLSSDIYRSGPKKGFTTDTIQIPKSYQSFFEIKNGMGFQDFSPENHVKKYVWTYAVSGGFVYKDTYKVGLGLSYRKYQHYYDFIVENQIEKFKDNPNRYASNVFVFLNTEILMSHVSINIDGGLNLHKPFYKTHYLLLEEALSFKYELKKLFLGRMGLKLYLNNTRKLPENNFFIGTHINSNLSQADFFEFSVGYVHRLPYKWWKYN